MAYGKWIGGFLGFINTGGNVLGAIAGFVLGALFDSFSEKAKSEAEYSYEEQQRAQQEGNRNGFLFSMMVLAAHIIKADGKIMHSEMEYVRNFLRNSFGEEAVVQGNDILLKLFEYHKQQGDAMWDRQIRSACGEIAVAMPEEHRIQLMAFLAEITKADGSVDPTEIAAMREIAAALGLNTYIVDQLLSLGQDSLEDAYKVLGVSPNATDDEVKQAYKKLVIKNHPDRVASLGEDIKKAATIKLQEINKAKDIIYKARGIK